MNTNEQLTAALHAAFVARGFEVTDTGGGCRAHSTADGIEFLVTDDDGASLAEWGRNIVIGHYAKDDAHYGDQLGMWALEYVENIVATDKPGYVVTIDSYEVHDAFVSVCGRFDADPVATWRMPVLVAELLRDINYVPQAVAIAALTPEAVAKAFCAVVRESLDGYELSEVIARNKTPEYTETGSCATHDFCDANMLMLQAFTDLLGYEPDSVCDDPCEWKNGVQRRWNAAWNLAVAAEFDADRIGA